MNNIENLTVKLNVNDNVATALREINAGEITQDLASKDIIPKGHKIALRKIVKGEKIIKYDQLIGIASKDILPGEHVHVENTNFQSTDHDYEFSTSVKLPNMIHLKEYSLCNSATLLSNSSTLLIPCAITIL